jgi:poly(3-hydroxybutyrate) depolymerase
MFSPGSAVIEAEAENRLQALSQILGDRPALRLEIAGHIDPANDYEGIKQMRLRRQIITHKLAADARKGETRGALAEIELTPDEYSQYLEVEYKATDFEKPTNFLGLTKKLPDQEMEQLLLQQATVSADEMNELAQNRALAAQNWLLEKGGIAGDRVFVTGAMQNGNAANDKGSRVLFTLK